ncbi:MAG: ParB family protein [Ectopseudomonas guguanensis]|uniref:ParB family protein n=1 Tax=Ectopseudomonas guguanensis TaxID=1198456 RepID=UPI003919D87B
MKPVLQKPSLRDKLLVGHFGTTAPQPSALSDPLEPVQVVLTLDQMRPYNLNPRVKKNEKYDEIKDSIRARGLDSPPQVSRRPGEEHYTIHNGGNTRLQILGELWQETRDERFYRITCLFKPWTSEIFALTGHMAENDTHGRLIWIERCLGVAQAKALYQEQDEGKEISQRELARRLKADGYPIDQSHLSRMEQTLQYLFPHIPNVLWNGMGVDGVRTLLTFRSNAEKAWIKLIEEKGPAESGVAFEQLFSTTLSVYDEEPEGYVFSHFKDDLIGAMTDALRENDVTYEHILFEIEVAQDPKRAAQLPANSPELPPVLPPSVTGIPGGQTPPPPQQPEGAQPATGTLPITPTGGKPKSPPSPPDSSGTGSVVSLPVSTGGLTAVSDIWAIYPQQDSIQALRNLADLIALEVANWAGVLDHMRSTQDQGLGFTLKRPETFKSAVAETTWQLLASLSANSPADDIQPIAPDDLAELLIQHLPDDLVIKVFRLIRLARRAKELNGEK